MYVLKIFSILKKKDLDSSKTKLINPLPTTQYSWEFYHSQLVIIITRKKKMFS